MISHASQAFINHLWVLPRGFLLQGSNYPPHLCVWLISSLPRFFPRKISEMCGKYKIYLMGMNLGHWITMLLLDLKYSLDGTNICKIYSQNKLLFFFCWNIGMRWSNFNRNVSGCGSHNLEPFRFRLMWWLYYLGKPSWNFLVLI